MSLAQALAAHTPSKPGPKCAIYRLFQELDPDDAAALTEALADKNRWPHVDLARRLRAEGYDVGRDSVSRHRKGDCACGTR